MDELRGMVAAWKAGRDGREVAMAASDLLDDVHARLERVRARFPGVVVDLGDDVQELLAIRNRMRLEVQRPRLATGIRRAASLL
jgi:hypothetical protein